MSMTPAELKELIEAKDAEIARLREDVERFDDNAATWCESCGAPLFDGDDFVSDPDSVAGCWHSMTDLPSKRERPCYAYRVGKQDARAALENSRG